MVPSLACTRSDFLLDGVSAKGEALVRIGASSPANRCEFLGTDADGVSLRGESQTDQEDRKELHV